MYDGAATLYVRVFREDGRHLGCSPESDSDDDDGRRGGIVAGAELALGEGRAASSSGGSSSGESTSDGDYDEPPRRWARTGEGDELPRRRTPVK